MYGSAAETSLRKLDNIQHQVLRLCTGAIQTTPITALQVENGGNIIRNEKGTVVSELLG